MNIVNDVDHYSDARHRSCFVEWIRRRGSNLCIFCGIKLKIIHLETKGTWHSKCQENNKYINYPHQ